MVTVRNQHSNKVGFDRSAQLFDKCEGAALLPDSELRQLHAASGCSSQLLFYESGLIYTLVLHVLWSCRFYWT